MTEIIARSVASARPSHVRKKAKPADAAPQQPTNEAEALCRQAVGIVSSLIEQVADHTGAPALELIATLHEVDCLLMYTHDPAGHEGLAAYAGELGKQLRRAYGLLDCVVAEIPERWSASAGLAVHGSMTVSSALALVKALETSYETGDLQRLRALGTYQGAMEVAVQGRGTGPGVPEPTAAAQIHESFGQLAALLKQAARTDEPHAHSGDSDRLLRIGGELAARAEASLSADDCEDLAFDIAACVSASRRVPGDTQSPKRTEFIKVAAQVLAVMASTTIEDIVSMEPSSRFVQMNSTASTASGLTFRQLRCVLGRIARDTSILNQMLMAAQATSDEALLTILIDGAQAMAEKIGAMADDAIEGDVMGGYDHWFYGPNFGQRGDGGAA